MRIWPLHGLLVIDKPGGMTSRDVVNRAQGWFPPGTRIGHTGTLDPLATGVLVLCVGAATRLAHYVQGMEKTYRATFKLGARSDTDDTDGSIEALVVETPPDETTIKLCLADFLGEIEQAPPAYSAVKAAGERSYKLARRGNDVTLAARRVRIHDIAILRYEYPLLDVEVRCGKGTYIRSLARDLGERLGCGALVATLRRTRVGPFEAGQALSLDADTAAARASLLPMSAAVAGLPRLALAADRLQPLRQGQSIPIASADLVAPLPGQQEVAVFDEAGELAAIADLDQDQMLLKPTKVLPAPEPAETSP
ncbi:MAG TPA: tRNA pseudouridine(55) synthase TruB [Gemmataceae bacterium]|nr:tRNA pseudouridine(55) synthase TruB [Gemmataceae bacterium]